MRKESIQSKISKSHYPLKRVLSDNQLNHIGFPVHLVRIKVEENTYGDEEIEILEDIDIIAYIDYPGSELPLTNSDFTNQSSQGIHLYDLLPIEAYFKYEDDILLKDILIHKINITGDHYRLIILQPVDLISKASLGVVWKKYIMAPYTLSLKKYPKLRTIFEAYKNRDESL